MPFLSPINNRVIFFTSVIKIVLRQSSSSREERVAKDETWGIVLHGEAGMVHPLSLPFQTFALRWWMWLHGDTELECALLGLNHADRALNRSSGRVLTQPQPPGFCLTLHRFLPTVAWWPWAPTGTLTEQIPDSSSPARVTCSAYTAINHLLCLLSEPSQADSVTAHNLFLRATPALLCYFIKLWEINLNCHKLLICAVGTSSEVNKALQNLLRQISLHIGSFCIPAPAGLSRYANDVWSIFRSKC